MAAATAVAAAVGEIWSGEGADNRSLLLPVLCTDCGAAAGASGTDCCCCCRCCWLSPQPGNGMLLLPTVVAAVSAAAAAAVELCWVILLVSVFEIENDDEGCSSSVLTKDSMKNDGFLDLGVAAPAAGCCSTWFLAEKSNGLTVVAGAAVEPPSFLSVSLLDSNSVSSTAPSTQGMTAASRLFHTRLLLLFGTWVTDSLV